MPKTSIVVPVYNVEQYVEKCANSILAQTDPDFELLLVDDGSTDASGTICDRIAGKDARVRVIHQPNAGLGGARNTGKIIPVPLGMKLTPLDIKLSDSQFFELKKYTALQIAAAFGVKPNQINDYSKSSYANSELQQLSFYVDTELFVIKQYEEEINYKMLTDEEQDDGFYYKYNEKVLFRTDSKTQMEYLKNGVSGSIMKPNEARRKLDLPDGEGGDTLLANGSIVPLTMAGAAYLKGASEPDETEKPEQPEETEPDTEQPDADQPDETDEAEDEDEQEGGE